MYSLAKGGATLQNIEADRQCRRKDRQMQTGKWQAEAARHEETRRVVQIVKTADQNGESTQRSRGGRVILPRLWVFVLLLLDSGAKTRVKSAN